MTNQLQELFDNGAESVTVYFDDAGNMGIMWVNDDD